MLWSVSGADDGLWAKDGGVNVMQLLYPLHSPIQIGAGHIEASNKLYTKHSVKDYSPPAADTRSTPLVVSLFSVDGIMVKQFSTVGKATVSISAATGGMAIIAIKTDDEYLV